MSSVTMVDVAPKDYWFIASHQFPQRGCFAPGWEITAAQTFYQQGLVASAFTSHKNKQIVILFHLLDKTVINQNNIICAQQFAQDIKEKADKLNYGVSYTGKHRGGTIAEICSMQDKLPCYTFNSEPVKDM